MAMQWPLAPQSHLLSRPGLALVIMLASACTTVDREKAPEAPIVPVDLEAWEARGKAAVTMGSETETVRFVWQPKSIPLPSGRASGGKVEPPSAPLGVPSF